MGVNKFFHALAFVALISSSKVAFAAQHVVGGNQGWDESTDYSTWASGQKFIVGDQLVFKYTAGLHSVVELGSESEYKKCDISSAVDSVLNGGNNVVKLNKAGTRYFTCGTPGHCGQGMKVKITTVAAADSTNSSPSTPESASSSSSSTTTTTSAAPSFSSAVLMSLVLIISFFLAPYM